MDRQESGPPQRESSLPRSLHRLMVHGPSQSRRSPTQDDTGWPKPEPEEEPEEGHSWGIPLVAHGHPIASSSTAHQPLPSLVFTHATFEEGTESGESAGSRPQSQSVSPAPGAVSQDPGAATRPTLPLPPLPLRGTVRSDPTYYASMPSYPATYSVPPPGPSLRPVSWSPTHFAAMRSSIAPLGSLDRGEPPPPESFQQRRSSLPEQPVAGPSRLPHDPPASTRQRRLRAKKPQPAISSQEAPSPSPSGNGGASRRRYGSVDSSHSLGSTSGVPPSRFLAEGPVPIQQVSHRTSAGGVYPVPIGAHEREISPRERAEDSRGSLSSSLPENYVVAVGSTTYHVTTLLPLRSTALPPGVEPAVASPSPAPVLVVERPGSVVGPSHGGEAEEANPEPEASRATESGSMGKRGRRTRGEKDKESGSSESSEHAHAPKSKKTLIACHFCRARKLRCDGQKPSCANCSKRSHPCTYEQQPKRRGPGKTSRGSTRRRGRHSGAGGGGGSEQEAGWGQDAEGERTSEATNTPEVAGPSDARRQTSDSTQTQAASASVSASSSASVPGVSPSFPSGSTQRAFEPQLTGPAPTYPGLSYRPPSPSSSYGPGSVPSSVHSLLPGPSRSSASESVQSSTTPSIPSVPDSEEIALVDYEELERFYTNASRSPDEPSQ